MKETELKPCPFCGGEAFCISFVTAEVVRCMRCGATITEEKIILLENEKNNYATSDSKRDMVRIKWNRRSDNEKD